MGHERSSEHALATTASTGGEIPEPKKRRRLDDLVSPELLQLLAESSEGFRFAEDEALAVKARQTGQINFGYTNKKTKTIYVNPILWEGDPQLGIKPWESRDARGFTYHEAGHHAPSVLEYDDALIAKIQNPELVPAAYRGDPQAEQEFAAGVYRHLVNGLVDMWLESYMSRHPYAPVEKDIREFNVGMGENPSYKHVSKPEQWMQILLRSRYLSQTKLEERVDPDVLESYNRVLKSGAIKTTLDRRAHENYFSSPADRQRSIARKVSAYDHTFWPEYIKLVEAELEERGKQRQERQQPEPGQGQKSKPGSGSPSSEAVPLTPEERQELLEELAKELQAAGDEFMPLAPEAGSEKEQQDILRGIFKAAQDRAAGVKPAEAPAEEKPDEDPLAAARELARRLDRESQQRDQTELAKAMNVEVADIRRWEAIKRERADEVQTLAAALTEILVDDRRSRIAYLQKEGEIVPGLEYETIAAMESGTDDPETKMRTVKNPDFIETEIEFIGDVSGSMMSGGKDDRSVEMLIITVEAMRLVREQLAAEGLLQGSDDEPLRIGLTKFGTTAERVTALDEPLTEAKELKIVSHMKATAAGTDEREAIQKVHKGMSLRKKNVIKAIIMFTDGQGAGSEVAPIIQQIEDDPEVMFLVLGLGDDTASAEAITETYLEPLRKREDTNVFAEAVPDSKEMIPKVIDFLRREIGKRRPSHR